MFDRDFKGIWIPREVWLDTRLTALEKIVLVEIDSLEHEERGCFASNKYLAEFCQCSESKITKAISKLIELNYVYVKNFDGRQRELRSSLSNYDRQGSKKYEAACHNLRHSNIENNIENNIVISTTTGGGVIKQNPFAAELAQGEEVHPEEYYHLHTGHMKCDRGLVLLSDWQFDLLCDKLSIDEVDKYIKRLADYIHNFTEKTGKPPHIKSHYATILQWVEEDRRG